MINHAYFTAIDLHCIHIMLLSFKKLDLNQHFGDLETEKKFITAAIPHHSSV